MPHHIIFELFHRLGGKRVKRIVAVLSAGTFVLAFVPQFTGCCAVLGFATNIIWLYGVE